MSEIVNGVSRLNVAGDNQAAIDWGLATQFEDPRFTVPAALTVAGRLANLYDSNHQLWVAGIGSGSAYYEKTICDLLTQTGMDVRLVVSDMQQSTITSVRGANTYALPSDSTWLPLARPKNETNMAFLSRAFEHYISDESLHRLLIHISSLLVPGEQYITQLSSGDATMLAGFQELAHGLSGKEMSYFTPECYMQMIDNLKGTDDNVLFTAELIGWAPPQPRDVYGLAKRYLNNTFWDNNREFIENKGVDKNRFREETSALTSFRHVLAQRVQNGELNKSQADLILRNVMSNTASYGIFREYVVTSVTSHLSGSNTGMSRNLEVIENGADVRIEFEYPIIALSRTSSPHTDLEDYKPH